MLSTLWHLFDYIGHNTAIDMLHEDGLEASYDAIYMHTIIQFVFRKFSGTKGYSKEKMNLSCQQLTDANGNKIFVKNDLILKLSGIEVCIGETKRESFSLPDFIKGLRVVRSMFEAQVVAKAKSAAHLEKFTFLFVQLSRNKIQLHVAIKSHLHLVQMQELIAFAVPMSPTDLANKPLMIDFLRGMVQVFRFVYFFKYRIAGAIDHLSTLETVRSVDTTSQTPRRNNTNTRSNSSNLPTGAASGTFQGSLGSGASANGDQSRDCLEGDTLNDFTWTDDEICRSYNCIDRSLGLIAEPAQLLTWRHEVQETLSFDSDWYAGTVWVERVVNRVHVYDASGPYEKFLKSGKCYVLKQLCTPDAQLRSAIVTRARQEYRMHVLAQHFAPMHVIPIVVGLQCNIAQRKSQIVWWSSRDEQEQASVVIFVLEVGSKWGWLRKSVTDWLKDMRHLARGLALLHGHALVHGDLKFANVLEYGGHVVLCDFGHAEDLSSLSSGFSGSFGTPAYRRDTEDCTMSPMDDVYSFGCMLCYGLIALTSGNEADDLARERCFHEVEREGVHNALSRMKKQFSNFTEVVALADHLLSQCSGMCMIDVGIKLNEIIYRLEIPSDASDSSPGSESPNKHAHMAEKGKEPQVDQKKRFNETSSRRRTPLRLLSNHP